MRDLVAFLKKYNYWFVFVILEVVSMLLMFQYNSYHGSVWFSSANYVTGLTYEVDSKFSSFMGQGTANQQLTQRNLMLEREVAILRAQLIDERMQRDSSYVYDGQMPLLNQYKLIPARVISNSINKADNFITIDKGRYDGVHEDMGVACGNGVVGIVYMASDHYAVVIPVLNASSSRISCSIRNREYFGYLHWYGGDPSVAYVEDVPRHARFKLGEWVETSGFSTIFPPGVLVGKIEKAYNSSDGLSYKLKVRLSTDFSCVRDVFVISDKSIAERAILMQAARDSVNADVRKHN
jgi:rod shape-determining protein MreC